ncbi:MAG: hypothetical protein GY822_07515 [Deltaproteobacteria bacterium]|nr:hypothetical protein [Deltaproteobacteria bacterium]
MKKMARILLRGPPKIAPFDEAASQLPVGLKPLRKQQEVLAKAFGRTLVEVDEGQPFPEDVDVAIAENVFVNEAAFEKIVRSVDETLGIRQLALSPNTALFRFLNPFNGGSRAALTSTEFSDIEPADTDGSASPQPICFFSGKLAGLTPRRQDEKESSYWHLYQDGSGSKNEEVHSSFVFLDEKGTDSVRVPPYGRPPHLLHLPANAAVAGTVHHWLHVLHLNLAELFAQRLARGATQGRNIFLGTVDVHPTAFVENSILEDGVEVEAGASVMNSWIGPHVKVADHAVLDRCVVDEHCHTLIDTHLRRVVAFSGSTLSNLGTEDLLLGRNIFITTAVAFFGGVPGKNVFVDGENTLRPCLGGVVGHGATLGARSLFEAGASVPSGLTVVGRPDDAIARFSEVGLARAHAVLGDPTEDA